MDSHIGNIMTLSNSIIGVSILAMPFCFKQCGIVLAIIMLLISSIITRLTCHFLLKSATMSRRRTFELLAFHAFGTAGKFVVELGIIGFLMGTCIAFFVIIGDLGPAIIAKIIGTKSTDTLRTSILIGVALFCVLPLGLLKNVDSLHSVSTATIGFYFCLVLKTISESTVLFITGDWLSKVELWRPIGVLQCLPIFAMALSCQTQLFEIYETVSNPSLDKMNYIVRMSINICVAVYICVGFFGYAAFSNQNFTGNILMSFSPSPMTDAMKIGFVLSVAFSFPLVIFPCRASLYSLLFKKGYTPYEGANNYIPESKFKFLTALIVFISLIIGISIPNIEVVLGLIGSTIGTMICVIFPVTCFICISTKNTNERLLAQILLFIGIIAMVLGTYANLYAMEQINDPIIVEKTSSNDLNNNIMKKIEAEKIFQADPVVEIKNIPLKIPLEEPVVKIEEKHEDIRQEPPQPEAPQEEERKSNKLDNKPPKIEEIITAPPIEELHKEKEETEIQKPAETATKKFNSELETETKKAEEVDIEAIKKEDTELQEEEKGKKEDNDEKQKVELLRKLEEHKKEQENLIKEQKKLIQELKKEKLELKEKQQNDINVEQEARRKAANEILQIAKKAIEQLAPDAISQTPLQESRKPEEEDQKKAKQNNKTIIFDPIAKKIMDFANNNKNTLNKNIPSLPIPIVINKTLTKIKLTETNENEINNQKEHKIEDQINQNNIETTKNEEKTKKQTQFDSQKLDDSSKKDKSMNRMIEKSPNYETSKLETKKEEKETQENVIPIGRDILANEESSVRIKREAEENLNKIEKCDITDKIQKADPPLLKDFITKMSKTDILKFESNNLIQSMKDQLKVEVVHLKKK